MSTPISPSTGDPIKLAVQPDGYAKASLIHRGATVPQTIDPGLEIGKWLWDDGLGQVVVPLADAPIVGAYFVLVGVEEA